MPIAEKSVSPELMQKLFRAQKSELTEHTIYKKLSGIVKDKKKKALLEKISGEEMLQEMKEGTLFGIRMYYLVEKHYDILKKLGN